MSDIDYRDFGPCSDLTADYDYGANFAIFTKHISRSQRRPHLTGAGPSVPKICGTHRREDGLTQSREIWYDNRRGEEREGLPRHVPVPMGWGAPAFPQFLGPPTCAHTVCEKATKWHGDQTAPRLRNKYR